MRTASRLRDGAAAFLLCAIAAAYVTVMWSRAQRGLTAPGWDLMSADYPIILYMQRAVREGSGLLWNRFQSCGEPFLASSLSGVLYPPRWLFLVLPFDAALLAVTALHLALAGIGTYALARELGCRRAAALTGALVFELGGTAAALANWLPLSLLGEYALIAVAMWRCERLVRTPTVRNAVVLAVVLTVQILPGYPVISVFTYELIVLRAVWACLTPGRARTRVVATAVLALVLPALLGAVQLLPMIEFGTASIRHRALTDAEVAPLGVWTWSAFRQRTGLRVVDGGAAPFAAVPIALLGVVLVAGFRRRAVWFYALVTALSFALAFDTPLLRWYLALPFGGAFRFPHRVLHVTALGLAVLVALGVDTVDAPGRGRWRALGAIVGALAFVWLMPTPLTRVEWAALAVLVVAAVGRVASAWALLVPVLCAANLFQASLLALFSLPKSTALLYGHREAFAAVAARATPADRIYQFSRPFDFTIMAKSPSVYGVPSIVDYEPQTSQRYAGLLVQLFGGVPMTSINQFLYGMGQFPRTRPLLDLVAAHYLVVPADHEALPALARLPQVVERARVDGVAILENTRALPRAFFVPRARVVPDAATVLATLSSAEHDPRRVALLETAPADGFLGADGDAGGEARIVEDRSETLTVAVDAPADGFLFLSDQAYPGWQATVSGHPADVQRANYAFRLVRVPRGRSTVRFHYRPLSVCLGALVSLLTGAAVAVYLGAGVMRRRTGS